MLHPKVLCWFILLSFVWISSTDLPTKTAKHTGEADSFCGSPGKPRAGSVLNYAKRYKEGSIVKYRCNERFFRGDLKRRCVNGTWSGQMPVCTRWKNMHITKDNISFDDVHNGPRFFYPCTLNDKHGRLFCKLDESHRYIAEIFLSIFPLPEKDHQVEFLLRITSHDGEDGHSELFHLDLGQRYPEFYTKFKEPVHGDTLEIEVIRRKANTTVGYGGLKILVFSGCGEPEIPLHSVVERNGNDTSIIYKCINGYRLVGNVVRQCQKTGIWTGEQARCVKKKPSCGSPGTPAMGVIMNVTGQESFGEGDSVEYGCFAGYRMIPWRNYKRTCVNRYWTGQIPVCAHLYRTISMSVCNMTGTTKCFKMPYCLSGDNKPLFWRINLDKQYHVSSVKFYATSCRALQRKEDLCDHYFNISVSSNSITRWSFNRCSSKPTEAGDRCDFEYYFEDHGSPLANTIIVAVKNLPEDEQVLTDVCDIEFYGTEFVGEFNCGHPDSPLHSVVTYSNDSRTAYYQCKPRYRAVGNIFVSRCADDLKWTELNMKCIKSEGANHLMLAVILVLPFGLLVFVLSTILGKILYRRWQKRREEQGLIEKLLRMEDNRQVALNPDVPMDEQADLLSYNRRWEFSRERLKLGRSLGEGAFGTVMKAEAIGIIAGESTTTVAVKMVKYQGNNEHLKALISELKILAYVGHHVNIVNLLGAVTKNLAKGELMVITEYCEFGNLRNFLLCQRDRFINQIDPETGGLIRDIDAVAAQSAETAEKYCQHRPTRKFRSSLHECRQKILSLPPDSTRDLISYAFQCARGMEFLSSKKLVHRDLAARNVLLAENKVIKICDFGLSRKTYEEYAYVRKGKGPLPIKWMATESICDRVFTTKSDVWSFGVLLWEIFTLGADPYPGEECNEEFYNKLKGGYRLKKPDLAPIEVHNLMQQTWQENPKDRPTFTEIAETLGNLLEESVRSYYLDLNEPHAQFNEAMAQNMQFEPTIVSDISATDEDVVSEIRESDVQAEPSVSIYVKTDDEVQFTAKVASLNE